MPGRWQLDPAPQRQQRWQLDTLDPGTAFLRGLGDSASFSIGDEVMGGIAGVQSVLGGGDYMSAYRRQADQSRANLREAWHDQPIATGGGELAGFLAPGFGAGKLVMRGTNLAGRLARSAGVGAAFGGFSGAASGITPEERLQGLGVGAAGGAALGLVGQGVLGEALPSLWGRGRRFMGLPQEGGRMGVAERARDDLLTAARQNERLGVRDFNDLGGVISQAAAREPSLTVAEALGRSAINRVTKYSRLPGKTAERAEQNLERNADTFDALTQRLDDHLTPLGENGAPLTMRGASGELDAAFDRASTEGYQTAFANSVGPEHAARMEAIIARHPEFYQRAVDEATLIARGEGVNGFRGNNDPRLWHYVKVAAGDVIRTMRREGLGATRARQYTMSLRNLVDELDQVPGYRAARQQWGSLSEAREAMEAGFAFDKMRPEEMQALVGRLTPFQRRYLQAGVSERIRDVLERRDNTGLVNIARDLTNRRRGQLLRAAFGDKAGPIDDFLEYARLRRQMHQDAVRMASSRESPTGIVTGESVQHLIPTGSISAKAATMRILYENTVGKLGERNRDVLGRILLTPVGAFQREGRGLLARAQREAQRRISRTRLQRTRGAYLSGIGGAGVYQRREDE